MLDLEPSQTTGSGNCLEDRIIQGSEDQRARFPATHGRTSYAEAGLNLQHIAASYFLRDFWPDPLV
jgi:hypothetical protein